MTLPSASQLYIIGIIENNLGIKFNGKNTKDAQQFISKYIHLSKVASERYKKSKWQKLKKFVEEQMDKSENQPDYYNAFHIVLDKIKRIEHELKLTPEEMKASMEYRRRAARED